MKFTAKEIADLLQGTVDGDPQIVVDRFSKIEEGSTGSLSFLANPKYEDHLYNTGASVVLVNRDFEPASAVKSTLVRVENAYQALAKLLQLYAENKKKKAGIHASAVIADNARLGENIFIGPLVTIGEGTIVGNGTRIHAGSHIGENVRIGDDSTIHPGVKIYDDCVIGKACTIHGGAIIGADGFGFAPNTENEYQKVPQIGNVVLEDMVEIGANTTIDRATMGSTVIRKGAKLDNLIQI
ncbi:MAG: UDP-3-O-(3-hydroxymyristoyl)glucosamine N-acyltransferase, partial [Flavobacteriales bacterium]|nr:UDP-3-O-(3-hydroxymyristoyl)glucosamine N-acyltransferase [Flavobacteriales bacterium]